MTDFKADMRGAEDKLFVIVNEVRSSTRKTGSPRSSRFDKYVPRDSGDSRGSDGGGPPSPPPAAAVSAVTREQLRGAASSSVAAGSSGRGRSDGDGRS
eukprot:4232081-Karenia_brevis.AAC.1